MSKKKKLIVGNWKMNPGTLEEAKGIFSKIKNKAKKFRKVDVVICPPFPYIQILANGLKKGVSIGAQDTFWQNGGSFTGEVSPEMVKSVGGKYVLIGHSERRSLGETDEIVAKKAKASLENSIKTIVCVGEKDHDVGGDYLHTLREQIKNSLGLVQKKNLSDLIMAYEPVWAIGKNYKDAMKARDIEETALFVKKVVAEIFGNEYVGRIPVLYGGSVHPMNIKEMSSVPSVDGFLVGRESLDPENFIEIIKCVNES